MTLKSAFFGPRFDVNHPFMALIMMMQNTSRPSANTGSTHILFTMGYSSPAEKEPRIVFKDDMLQGRSRDNSDDSSSHENEIDDNSFEARATASAASSPQFLQSTLLTAITASIFYSGARFLTR